MVMVILTKFSLNDVKTWGVSDEGRVNHQVLKIICFQKSTNDSFVKICVVLYLTLLVRFVSMRAATNWPHRILREATV